MEAQKVCQSCREVLPVRCFWKDSSRKDGFDTRCKPCRNGYVPRANNSSPARSVNRLQQDTLHAPEAQSSNIEKILVIPDCHIPYHSKAAWNVMLAAARVIKPDGIVILGDFGDWHSVTRHTKNPEREHDLRWEVEQVNACLDQLDALGASWKRFCEGNHEQWLDRYLSEKAPELFTTVKLRELLRLDERGWTWTSYRDHVKIGKVYYLHDSGPAGRGAHLKTQAKFNGNIVQGHTHRLEYNVVGNAAGESHVALSLGWLGDLQYIDYDHRINALVNWAHAFGVAYVEPNGNTHILPVPIFSKSVIVEGRLVTAP